MPGDKQGKILELAYTWALNSIAWCWELKNIKINFWNE